MDSQTTLEFLNVWRSTACQVILQYPSPAIWKMRRDGACRRLRAWLQKVCRLQRAGGDWLEQLCLVEVTSICSQILYTLRSKDAAQILFDPELIGGLESLMFIVQLYIDRDIEPSVNGVCLRTLLRLGKTFNVFPSDILIKDIIFEGSRAVAEGNYAEIWRGYYFSEEVAVKVNRVCIPSAAIRQRRSIWQEMLIWRQLCHPNILPLMGLYIPNDSPSRLCLVSPWMENGNVHQYLTKYPCANRTELLVDIASGLNYLHALRPKIIHGDLKGLNILVTPMHRACLADFGVSIVATESCFKWSGVGVSRTGTLRWLAPELLDGSCPHNTLQTDIYAFACVCYEMYSGNIPFHDLKRDGQVIVLVSQGHRPTRPGHISDGMWSLIQECWEQEPSGRPTSREIMDRLLDQGKPSRSFALPYPIRNHYIMNLSS